MRIKSIKRIPFSGTVFNLSVEEDESYIANNIVVHNCSFLPLTVIDVEREGGVEVGSHKLPPNFPDEGFIKFSEDSNSRIKEYKEINFPVKSDGTTDIESLIKNWEDLVKEDAVKPYEWVIKCPYKSCGSSNIKPTKILDGALVYSCGTCNHQFKVLQEGDVYFYDVGKEEWINADHNMRPSYFIAELEGKKYYFTKKDMLDLSIEKAKESGIDISKIKISE